VKFRPPIRPHQLTAALLLAFTASAQIGGGQAPQEDELRAALVLGFARFTEWPAPRDGAIVVGVLGQPAIAGALERVAAGKSVNGRPVSIRTLRLASQAAGCHIVYFGRLPGAKLAEAVRDARAADPKAPLLTIGEDDRLLSAGGAVYLFEEDGRISFEVSLPALQSANVSISSKLLRLGYTTRENRRGRSTP
jgi:hypothetical protein